MKTPVLVLFILSCLLHPAVGRADDVFTYSAGETQVLRRTFASGEDWLLDGMLVTNGWLVGQPGLNWMKATLPLAQPADPAEGELNFYWSFRTDPNLGEEECKVYFRLNLTDTPGLIEQFNYTVNVRPGKNGGPPLHAGFWSLYVDPGFDIPHTAEAGVRPSVSFLTTNQVENFRLKLAMPDTNTVVATPYWWDRGGSVWQPLLALSGALPLTVDLATQATNNRVIRAVELQFYQATPAVDAIAITQKLSAIPSSQITRFVWSEASSELEWSGGASPWLIERSTNLLSTWEPLETNNSSSAILSTSSNTPAAFFRIRPLPQ